MEQWLQQFVQLLPTGLWYLSLLFLIAFAEGLPLFNLILPGSTLAVFAGFLVVQGKGDLSQLVVIHIAGAFCGDLASYWLGKHYGAKLLRWQFFQRHQRLINRTEEFFVQHGGKSLFFARFLGPIRGITPFIAGSAAMGRRPFLFYTLISTVLWGICYPCLGYLGGSSWQQAQSLTGRFSLLVGLLLAVVIAQHWLRRKFKL